MLVTVGGKKFRMNWKHDVVRNKVDELYVKYGEELSKLEEGARSALKALLAKVAPFTAPDRKRNGYTKCFIEELDGGLRFEGSVQCSRLDPYEKADGRERTMKQCFWPLAQALGMTYAEVKVEVMRQYDERMKARV